jgi:hypothetical protein
LCDCGSHCAVELTWLADPRTVAADPFSVDHSDQDRSFASAFDLDLSVSIPGSVGLFLDPDNFRFVRRRSSNHTFDAIGYFVQPENICPYDCARDLGASILFVRAS